MSRDGRDGRDGIGIQGPPGRDGSAGKDAYELVIARGYFSGTFEQWIASQRGRNGRSVYESAVASGFVGSEQDFVRAQKGAAGPKGDAGPRGPAGPAGPMGSMPEHQWRGTELRFQQGPDGTWGPYVDLRAPNAEAQTAYGVAVINQSTNSYTPSGW